MTFMRNIINAFNMDNWHKSKTAQPDYRNFSANEIQSFWKKYPPKYRGNTKESSSKDYEIYGKTLMLGMFVKASPLKTNFPVYFEYECHITNPYKLQSRLISEGYLEEAHIYNVLSTYKVEELKILADSIGCSKTGKKAELVTRIFHNLDDKTHSMILSKNNLYILSEKGRIFYESNCDYEELHRHWKYGVSLYDYNRNRFIGNRRRSFNDNIYTLVSQRIYIDCIKHNYSRMEQDYRTLYNISLAENRFDIALDSYLRSMYLKSCCVYCAQFFFNIYNNWDHTTIFTEHCAPPIIALKEFYNSTYIDNIYGDFSLPPSFLTKMEFISMVNDMLESIMFDYNKYNLIIISRLNKYCK